MLGRCAVFEPRPHPSSPTYFLLADFVSILLGWDMVLVLAMMKVVGVLQSIHMDFMTLEHQLCHTDDVC